MARGNAAEQQDDPSVYAAANEIEGILDDNLDANDGRLSRGHPDYDGELDHENQPRSRQRPNQQRNGKGQFTSEQDDEQDLDSPAADDSDDIDSEQAEDANTDDTDDDSTTNNADDQEQDTDSIKTLAELADALDVDLDTLKQNITHTFKAAGEERTVTLADMERGHQMEVDYQRNKTALAQEKRNFEQTNAEHVRNLQNEFGIVQQQYGAMEQLLYGGLQTPAMQELRESNPAEWNARQTEVGQQINWLRAVRQQAAENFQRFLGETLNQTKEREGKALLEAIPDWNNEKDTLAVKTMLDLGFTNKEVENVIDHRMIKAALELHTLRAENKALKEEKQAGLKAAKNVKKTIPTTIKPGVKAPGKAKGISRGNLAKAQERLRKTGKVGDAAKFIENLPIDF